MAAEVAAEVQPCSRGTAEVQPRDSRSTVEVQPRFGRGTAEISCSKRRGPAELDHQSSSGQLLASRAAHASSIERSTPQQKPYSFASTKVRSVPSTQSSRKVSAYRTGLGHGMDVSWSCPLDTELAEGARLHLLDQLAREPLAHLLAHLPADTESCVRVRACVRAWLRLVCVCECVRARVSGERAARFGCVGNPPLRGC